MTTRDEFYGLNGATVTKEYLETLSGRLYKDQAYDEARRAAYTASIMGDDEVEIEIRPQGLAGPSQNDLLKKALNDCGRLKPGYKFLKGGRIVYVLRRLHKKGGFVWLTQDYKGHVKGKRGKVTEYATSAIHNYVYVICFEDETSEEIPEKHLISFKKKPKDYREHKTNISSGLKGFNTSLLPNDDPNDFYGLSYVPYYLDNEEIGLAKGVSPDEIYEYITKIIIETIEVSGHLPWQRSWDKGITIWDGKQAVNYDSKKPYRGINYWFTNFKIVLEKGKRKLVPRDLTNPYFLTFNQIKKHKGTLKKDSKGIRVFYFTKLYTHTEELPGGKKLSISTYDKKKYLSWLKKNQAKIKTSSIERLANSYIPILKYYNVFHGADVTGIKWDAFKENKNPKLPTKERIQIAENIIKKMPNVPEILFQGNQPAYYPSFDHVRMTPIEAFKSEQEYYATLFHELIHSTGHTSRLNRFTGVKSTKKEYAFEELIAEMGAVFLCAESGILFSVINNSASYLAGWNKRLVGKLKKDNRYFFRASSKAQAATDYILYRDKEGVPAYLKVKPKKNIQKPTPTKNKSKQLQLGLKGEKTQFIKKNKTIISNNIEGLRSMSEKPQKSPLWEIAGETGKFLGNVERKNKESVVVILSTPKGTGKTTSAYKWINDFALNDDVLFASLEEHQESNLATDKEDKYIEESRKSRIRTTSDIPNKQVLYDWIELHDVIIFDSWQKLIAILGKLDLDLDFRKRFNGKIFVFIVQQTVDGKVKGGASLSFDGDIIVMGCKGESFKDNYLYFDKNRYTRIDLDKIRYNIESHKTFNPKEPKTANNRDTQPPVQSKDSWLSVS
ncbi:zincin-like metallopeptidase domain-containing protein [Dokdonia sp.]|uniref:zincin-like metallopeptidase domain-containing protein n=1 Tax=Dokdonia sp. TaxID=2024995 RepID=UPI003266C249